jgi:hypothetical protein
VGYEITVIESHVRIPRKQEPAALKRLQAATKAKAWEHALDAREVLAILRAKTLDAALAVVGWELTRDDDERVDGLAYEGKLSGNEQQVLNLLAPFVREGSWIAVTGENDDAWRWVFDGEEALEDWSGDDAE